MGDFEKLIGSWASTHPDDSDDYRSVYTISGTADDPQVEAIDAQDNESFEITNIQWDGVTLSFSSLMPSTGRKGENRFSVNTQTGQIDCEFTFTVSESLKPAALRLVN